MYRYDVASSVGASQDGQATYDTADGVRNGQDNALYDTASERRASALTSRATDWGSGTVPPPLHIRHYFAVQRA